MWSRIAVGSAGRDRGAIVVPFAVAFVTIATLFGMLTESMLVLHARHKLFNGAEQALLAAANMYQSQMSMDVSTTSKQEQLLNLMRTSYCTNNYIEPNNTTLDYSQIGSKKLILNTSKSINLLFFKNALTLSCNLAASVPEPVGSATGAAPIAMLDTDFTLGETYTIKERAGGPHSPGNYGALALGAPGMATFASNIVNGYSGDLNIGQSLSVEPGVGAGPTDQAIDDRLATGDDVLLIVLTDAFPNGSSGDIVVKGFAAFRITGSSGGRITGSFITYKISASSTSTTDRGVYTSPKLLFN